MTNEEILKKAIEKAQKNGFEFERIGQLSFEDDESDFYIIWGDCMPECCGERYSVFYTIFRHDFAKAFFGEYKINTERSFGHDSDVADDYILSWQYHLQQMVICEDPIKYLEQFLK